VERVVSLVPEKQINVQDILRKLGDDDAQLRQASQQIADSPASPASPSPSPSPSPPPASAAPPPARPERSAP
jgi:hypothetical protein